MRRAAKFLVGRVIRGPYANDYRKIRMRRWNKNSWTWEYAFDRTSVPITWFPEGLLKPLTEFEANR